MNSFGRYNVEYKNQPLFRTVHKIMALGGDIFKPRFSLHPWKYSR
jgi:hypothetical protein